MLTPPVQQSADAVVPASSLLEAEYPPGIRSVRITPSLVQQTSLTGSPCPEVGSTEAPLTGKSHPDPAPFLIERLKGWHLPLLNDPSFLPLHPLLQRSLLLAWPDRLLSTIAPRRALAPTVLVAISTDSLARSQVLGLIAFQRLNRTGSCWQVEHLRLPLAFSYDQTTPDRRSIMNGLVRCAVHSVPGAASWIASASSLDTARLANLREQGFQPQRTDRIWQWRADASLSSRLTTSLPFDLELRPLTSRTACLHWHLEQATCPAHLRHLLDRRVEDLLDQSKGRGWMLIDPNRNEAVAGVRWLCDRPDGGHEVDFSLHPGWNHLLGQSTEIMLRRFRFSSGAGIWLHSEVGDVARERWLEQIGAEPRGEEVLMARSVWRRQEPQTARKAVRRLAAVLEQLQPRRRPIPTPVTPLSWPRP